MDVWSRGLGNRTLNLRLEETTTEILEDGSLKIKGIMGPPVYWNFAITMKKEDIVDFFKLVNRTPDCVDFLVHSKNRWSIYYTMIKGTSKFLLTTIKGLFFGFPPKSV
jgi:hypothetical protein